MLISNNGNADTSKFSIGEIIKARERLWRIDQINYHKFKEKNIITYSVSNIDGQSSSQILMPEIELIEKATIPPISPTKIGSPIYQKLLLDASKLKLIYGTSSFISLQNSKVIPISYQMVPVLMALNLKRVRMLIADDVGLGKTIEAGLILQELLGRKKINRVLFVTPANLREQWQNVLRNFFGINAVIMSRRNRRQLETELMVGGNPWGYYNFIITSIDYAKKMEIKNELMQYNWDLVIIDEAHNVMKQHLGTEKEKDSSFKQSYGLAKDLSMKYENILLLTATPHNGHRDSYASLLELVNPNIINKNKANEISFQQELAKKYICQRRRRDVEEWLKKSSTKSPFPKRDSSEEYITPSKEFIETIEALNEFGEHVLNRTSTGMSEERRLNYWTILHFHKRAISSPNAIICSINNRIKEIDRKLAAKRFEIENYKSFLNSQEASESVLDGFETDRLTEVERDERSDKIIFTTTIEDLKKEKQLLEKVKEKAKKLLIEDSKIAHLIENILVKHLQISGKIIIFTRYIDTLTYIEEKLRYETENSIILKNLEIFSVHGQMPTQKRQENYNKFLLSKRAILISTDCMSEGIDLQFSANQLINYELTWNPNRLEQRNGRIDRFGQPKEKVYIRTLVLKDTLEMDILETLLKKAEEIRKAYGFIPGFFGEPEAVIDNIIKKRKKQKKDDSQQKLTNWIDFNFPLEEIDQFITSYFNEDNVKKILDDSFYGQSNINLEEIEKRMRLTEKNIGSSEKLFAFLKDAVNLYNGKIKTNPENPEIYQIILPEEVLNDLGLDAKEEYFVTTNREIHMVRQDIESVSLKNPLISNLVEKIRNETFSEENRFYGRMSAFASKEVSMINTIFHLRIRYLVNTEPKSMMEEIVSIGFDLFKEETIKTSQIEKIWNNEWLNHNKKNVELSRHLEKSLVIKDLEKYFEKKAKEQLELIIKERKEMIESLEKQGFASDLKDIDKIDVIGIDPLSITLVYPNIGGK